MLGIQIIGIVFGLFMMYLTFLYSKRNELTKNEQALWMLIWLVVIGVALFPQALQTVTETLRFNRTLDLLMVGSIVFVVSISFYTYSIVRKTERKMEELVRKSAIEHAEQKK
ncbi:DUF2304 domain-containing protein [Candidatus Woesearchaeota archaeon]|nr:DUF2304 domain-containing protein [Candidatus Woesearchaeota archaeon]